MGNCIQPSRDHKIKINQSGREVVVGSVCVKGIGCFSCWNELKLGEMSERRWKKMLEIQNEHQSRQLSSLHRLLLGAPPVLAVSRRCCSFPWPCLHWASQPQPLCKDLGTLSRGLWREFHHLWMCEQRDLREEQRPASKHRCSRHCFSSLSARRPPEGRSGRLQSTVQVERDLFQHFKTFLSLRAAHSKQVSLAHYLSSFGQSLLAGSPTPASRFKAKARDLPKALGKCARFWKALLYCFNENSPWFWWEKNTLNRPLTRNTGGRGRTH